MFHDYSSNRYSIRFHHFNEFYSGSIFQRDFNLDKFAVDSFSFSMKFLIISVVFLLVKM